MAGWNPRANDIFLKALAYTDAGERRACMDAECAGDQELKSHVERLILASERAGDFLEPPAAERALAATLEQHVPLAEGPGTVIGPYKLLQQIGEGGFGVVFMAEQERPIRRRVALKVIKLGMDTRQVIARFGAERQALAMMDHSNIARVLDAGATESGRPYFVMELVTGVPITEFCDANQLDTRQRLDLFAQVCRAVQHAHQKGIIHRDLKPSNVMVTMHDDRPVPKVIDFGIAKATQARLTEQTLFTEFKQFVGTPQYTSPEQAQMSGLDVDTRSDVYSLGVLLYELLTGTTPLDPKELRSAGFGEMQRIIREAEPQRPSTRLSSMGQGLVTVAARRKTDPGRLPRSVRGELDWIVMKCLEKDRTRRYDTANGLALDVERYLADEPVAARPATATYRLAKFIRRHRAGAIGTLAVVAALIVAVVGTSLGLVNANAARQSAAAAEAEATRQKDAALRLLGEVREAKANADRQARRATAANDYLQNMFRAARPPGKGGGGMDVRLVEVLKPAGERLNALKDEPEVELDLRLTLARTYDSLNLYPEAVEHYNRALALSRTLTGPESAQTLQITADAIFAMGKSGSDVQSMARDAAATARRVLGDGHPITLDTLNSLGLVLMNGGKSAEAEALYRDLVRRARQMKPDTVVTAGTMAWPKDRARFLNNLAVALKAQGRLTEAEPFEREAVVMANEDKEMEQRRPGPYRRNLAHTLIVQNKLTEAEALLCESVEQNRKSLGLSHPDTIEVEFLLAGLLEQRGTYAEALPLRQACLARASKWGFAVNGGMQFQVAELLLRTSQEQQARTAFTALLADGRKWSAEAGNDVASNRYLWARASLLCGLRIDRPWAGSGIRAAAMRVAATALEPRGWGDATLDTINWSTMRFKLERWQGDAAVADPPGPRGMAHVSDGGLPQLWSTADPEPGIYLLSLTLPRGEARPLRAAGWMWIAPWQLSFHLSPDDAAPPTMPPTTMPAADSVWTRALSGEPIERRNEPSLDFMRYWMTAFGHGPARRAGGFIATARTTALLPPGRYKLRIAVDTACRGFLDGKPLFESKYGERANVPDIDATDNRAGEFRFDWANDVVAILEPIAPAADTALAAVQDPLAELDAKLEQLSDQAAREPQQAGIIFDRGLTLARLGRFEEAGRDLANAVRLDPEKDFWAYIHVAMLAYQGDAAAHKAAARDTINRYGKSPRPEIHERLAKAAAALPGAVEKPAELIELADFAVNTGQNHEYLPWFKLARMMAEYRAGHDEGAVAGAADAVTALTPLKSAGLARATCHYFRAMALHRLKRIEEANLAFAQAEKEQASADGTPGRDDLGTGGIENWFICHAVQREAKATLASNQ